mgnify:CR=1 FL=1
MQVRCIHCGHGFEHEAPSFARGAATTVCPSCGRDTPATEEWLTDTGFSAGGAAVESRVYCFNCGCAMTPREGELIPVCDNCRQDQNAGGGLEDELPESDEPVADWMIRKANGNVYGPFPTETIVDWIRAKKINADEEIAHIGGAWRLFGQHEEFGKFFDSPADTGQQSAAEIDFRRKTPVKDALGRFGAAGFAVVALGLVSIGVWYAISNEALVIPEATLDQVADTVSDLGQKKPERNTMSQDARALVTSLVETHKGVEGSSMEHFLRGRTLMLRDNYANLVQARDQLEKAVVLDANNALALAALAELYGLLAHSGYDSLDLQRQSIYLLQMADASENYPAAVLRGHAAFDVYSGNFASGRTNAQAALQKNPEDPALHYLLGIAAMGKGNQITPEVQSHFDKALELDPSFHQVWYALAKAEEESGHLDKALEYYEKKIASDPGSSASHTRLASIHRSIGSYPTAMSHYDKAIGINRLEKDAFLDRAVLAYQVENNPGLAVKLLTPLYDGDGPELRVTELKTIGTHLSAALRLAGTPDRAIEIADEVRASSAEAVCRLQSVGVKSVSLLTGDHEAAARGVAGQLGITDIHADLLPDQKLTEIDRLRQDAQGVVMVGDGVNDAPALAQADVGLAIGAGTDVAIASAGVILASDDPRSVLSVIELSRAAYRKMKQNLWWAAGYNLISVPLAAGLLAPVGLVLPMSVGAILMSLSTIVVALNAQLLRRLDLRPDSTTRAVLEPSAR